MTPVIQTADLQALADTVNARAAAEITAAQSAAATLPTDAAGLSALLGKITPLVALLGSASVVAASPAAASDLPPLANVTDPTWQAGHWNINNWANPGQEGAWTAANVRQSGTDVVLALNPQGEAQIQTTDAYASGEVEFDFTVPLGVLSGQDAAFFLYAGDGTEIDVEVLKGKLWLCVHNPGGKQFPNEIDGDFSGKRLRGSITWSAKGGVVIAIKGDGFDDINWTAAEADLEAQGMSTPTTAMQAFFSNGQFLNNAWAGQADPITSENVLVAHGFRYTQ